MNKTYLLTVSDDRFGRKNARYAITQNFISNEIVNPNGRLSGFGIDEVKNLDLIDIKQSDYYDNPDIKVLIDNIDAARNGRVYKPIAINIILALMEEGDYLIYNDCSPEVWNYPDLLPIKEQYNIQVLKDLCDKNNGILTSFVKWDTRPILKHQLGIHTHRNFTTNRCIDTMHLREYENSFQHASGMIVLRKCHRSVNFAEEWLYWNSIPECCALGNPNVPNDYSFWDETEEFYKIGHRHDQSISGLLINRMGNPLVDINYDTNFNNYNFLNFCRTDIQYNFIDCNLNPEPVDEIRKGDMVLNEHKVELRVFEIGANEIEGEYLRVGKHRESTYNTKRENLTKIII